MFTTAAFAEKFDHVLDRAYDLAMGRMHRRPSMRWFGLRGQALRLKRARLARNRAERLRRMWR